MDNTEQVDYNALDPKVREALIMFMDLLISKMPSPEGESRIVDALKEYRVRLEESSDE